MNALKLIIALLLFSNLMNAQGFELIFGGNTNNNTPYRIVEVPNEDAYLVIDKGPISGSLDYTLNITKVDLYGSILFSIPHPYPGHTPLDFVFMETSFKVALGGDENLYILEFDYLGQLLSEIEHTIPDNAFIHEIKFLSDQSIIFSEEIFFGDTYNITRLSPDGTLIWKKEDAFLSSNFNNNIYVLPDDDFLIFSSINVDLDILYKFDQNGDMVWENTEVPDCQFDHYMIPYPDLQTYLIYGDNADIPVFGTYLAAVSADGELNWSQDFSDHLTFIDELGVIPGESNTLYVTGKGYLNNASAEVLFQIDVEGNILWEKKYTEFVSVKEGQLLRDRDNGFIIAAAIFPGQGLSFDPYVMKVDEEGEMIWSWYQGREDYYLHKEAILTEDGGYLILGKGEALSDEDNYKNYLTKLDSNGNIYTHHVNGQLVIDSNQSCDPDMGEQGLSNWLIQLDGRQTYLKNTDEAGYFSIDCNADTVLLKAIPPNDLWEPCPQEIPIIFTAIGDTVTVHPTMQAVEACPALELDISTPFLRRCFDNTYYVTVKNTGTILAENVQLSIELDSFFILQNVSISNYTFSDQLIYAHIGDIGVDETFSFSFQVEVSCEAPLGETHCVYGTSYAQNDCSGPSFSNALQYSELEECQTNGGSYDPNDKRAFSEGKQTEQYIAKDSLIEYQIRFQNTGTDTAFNIVIIDTLSEYLDITTFRLGASSHPVRVDFEPSRSIKFIFDHIMLPDSNINEAASHGFVKFKIHPVSGLDPGVVIPNQASIYFDFNDPIYTNVVALEIGQITSTHSTLPPVQQYLSVFPQPANADVYFSFVEAQLLQQGNFSLEVFNANGQLILDKSIQDATFQITGLKTGIYFYRLLDAKIPKEVGKFMVVNQ